MSDVLGLDPVPPPDGLGILAEDWQQTSMSVRQQVLSLLKRIEVLEARLHRDSSNSSQPPSTDSPATKRQRRTKAAERRKPEATPGHRGYLQALLEPTASVSRQPDVCACGHGGFAEVTLYHTHQVMKLPVMRPVVQSRVALGACERI